MNKLVVKTLCTFILLCSVLLSGILGVSAESFVDADKNTSIKEAKSIKLNTAITEYFEHDDDKDYYVLDVKRDGTLTINLESEQGVYLDVVNIDQTTSLQSTSVNTFINVLDKNSKTVDLKKGKHYLLAQTSGYHDIGSYNFSTIFKPTVPFEKVMWGKTELKVGQIGKVTIISDTSLEKLNNDGTLSTVRA